MQAVTVRRTSRMETFRENTIRRMNDRCACWRHYRCALPDGMEADFLEVAGAVRDLDSKAANQAEHAALKAELIKLVKHKRDMALYTAEGYWLSTPYQDSCSRAMTATAFVAFAEYLDSVAVA